jgi:hypothetical protein
MKNEDNDSSRVDTTGNAASSRTASANEKAPRILTIDRSKWYRGMGGDYSALLRSSTGQMCCLGFDALARGLSASDIEDCADPTEVDVAGEYRAAMFGDEIHLAEAVHAAIRHNDEPRYSETERERLIREDLIALGWDDVVFVDGGATSDARFTDSDQGKADGSATKGSSS